MDVGARVELRRRARDEPDQIERDVGSVEWCRERLVDGPAVDALEHLQRRAVVGSDDAETADEVTARIAPSSSSIGAAAADRELVRERPRASSGRGSVSQRKVTAT